MPRFPYINFPFSYYSKPINPKFNATYYNTYYNAHSTSPHTLNNYTQNSCDNSSNPSANFKVSDSENYNPFIEDISDKKNKSNNNNFDYLFDLFGLKIYSDDILLVSLIYFLYSEDVKDEGLFIVLILLLLS